LSDSDISDLLDAITQALETGDIESLKKTLEGNTNFQSLLSGRKTNGGETSLQASSSSDSLAAILANLGAAVQQNDAAAVQGTQGRNGAGALDNDDGVKNTTPLNSTLSDLPAVKSEASTVGRKSGSSGAEDVTGSKDVTLSDTLLAALLTANAAASAVATSDAANGADSLPKTPPATDTGAEGSKSETASMAAGPSLFTSKNQADQRTGLSEDYLLLNSRQGKTDSESPFLKDILEVLETSSTATAATNSTNAQAGTDTRSFTGQIPDGNSRKQDTPAQGSATEMLFSSEGNKTAQTDLADTLGPMTPASAKAGAAAYEDREEKSQKAGAKIETSDKNGDASPYTNAGSQGTGALHAKEAASSSQGAPSASAMANKIEEMINSQSNKHQSMDMVLRLQVNDRETILVGLKNEGDKVVVEVKGGSESLMSMLQSQKGEITRELESKLIYATINVDTNGESAYQERNRQEQQSRNATNKEEEDTFGGILSTLA
jgi:hypothetical protein